MSPKILLLFLIAAFVPSGTARKELCRVHLETGATFTYASPLYTVYVGSACPPETEAQSAMRSSFVFKDGNGNVLPSKTVEAPTDQPFQKVLWSMVSSQTPFSKLVVERTFAGNFYTGNPVRNHPTSALPPDDLIDYRSEAFSRFLQSHPELMKKPGESSDAFAKRVFEQYPYLHRKISPTQVSEFAQRASSTLPTDCVGYAAQFAGVLNNGGVPAMLAVGLVPHNPLNPDSEIRGKPLPMAFHAITRLSTSDGWIPADSIYQSVCTDPNARKLYWNNNTLEGFFVLNLGAKVHSVCPWDSSVVWDGSAQGIVTFCGNQVSSRETSTMTCTW